MKVISDGRSAALDASSLAEMTNVYETVIVGRVTGVLIPYDPRPGYMGIPTPEPYDLPSGDPKAGTEYKPSPEELARPPGRVSTTYSVEVQRSFGTSYVETGSVIPLTQTGGLWNGEEHRSRGDPVVEVGQSYFMFMTELEFDSERLERYRLLDFWPEASEVVVQDGAAIYFAGSAFGRFGIGDDRTLSPVDEKWSQLPAVATLTGRTVDEAAEIIADAIAGKPDPTPLPPPPTSTPRPTPRAVAAVAIDTRTDGNDAKSLGAKDACSTLAVGDSRTIDIVVRGVPPRTEYGDGHHGAIIGFQFTIVHDPARVKIAAVDTDMLLGANDGSNTMYVGHPLNGEDAKNGRLTVAALDLNQESLQESGDGVLARIRFEGVSAGISDLKIENVDLVDTWNNKYNVDAIEGARIAVGGTCS